MKGIGGKEKEHGRGESKECRSGEVERERANSGIHAT